MGLRHTGDITGLELHRLERGVLVVNTLRNAIPKESN